MTYVVAAIALGMACVLWFVVARSAGAADAPEECGGCGACGAHPDGAPDGLDAGARRAARAGRDRPLRGTRDAGLLLLILLGSVAHGACARELSKPVYVRDTRAAMGTAFTIQAVTEDERTASVAIEAAFDEVGRLDGLLSEWRADSEISRLNGHSGSGPVSVAGELVDVLERSIEVSRVTGGAFDITVAACWSLWSFTRPYVPRDDEIRGCLPRVGWEKVEIDRAALTVRLAEPGMRIGISGIGKGYGVDAAADALEGHGILDYVVDGGGDVRVRGRNRERPWRVGIAHPRQSGRLFAEVELSKGAIVTSGDYMQYFERDGARFHHILDPRTGRPAPRSIAATVLAATATEADALATGLFVLGPDAGVALAESLPGVEALIFAPDATPHATSGFPPS